MIRKITANERHFHTLGWLQTYWLFSFERYYDPENVHFGALRVFNDDVIHPQTGFDKHSHKEMEIVSIVLEGQLDHEDSMGNKAVINEGEIQRMTAGTGIMHSEHNLGSVPTKLYQIWIFPNKRGLAPSYEQKDFSTVSKKNILLPVVSGHSESGTLSIQSDSTIYLSELEKGCAIPYTLNEGKSAFFYITQGHLEINGEHFNTNDQARISNERELSITAVENSSFILIDTAGLPDFMN